jgi:hypothetical protein
VKLVADAELSLKPPAKGTNGKSPPALKGAQARKEVKKLGRMGKKRSGA